MLYNATYTNGQYHVTLFDPSLGSFMPSSFVLSRQYMFVQVRTNVHVHVCPPHDLIIIIFVE